MESFRSVFERAAAAPSSRNPQTAARLGTLEKLNDWLALGEYRLQRVREPVWHKVLDAWTKKSAEMLIRSVSEPSMERFCSGDDKAQVFLVGHDWARAFENATDFDSGPYKLPFEKCVFELIVSERRVCVTAHQVEQEDPKLLYWAQVDDMWVCVEPSGDSRDGSLGRLMERNVRAMCIALDAEVAYAEVVRAPHKLNKARAKRGREPLPDYRVVHLTQKARATPADEHGQGSRKRLHFRRGHWRHFDTFKTWIRWTLVGDPDLGFVDKHYRF